MRKWFALLLFLPFLLGACGDSTPTPQPARLPKLPAGCVWVAMQGNGQDSNHNSWTFSWNQPICTQPTPTAAAWRYDPQLMQIQQQTAWVNTWLILRAQSSAAYGHYSSPVDEGGVHSDGEGGGGHASGGEGGK